MKNFSKNIILWIVIGILLIALFNLFQNSSSTNQSKEISFSDFLIAADNGNISEVKIVGIMFQVFLKMEDLFQHIHQITQI